MEKKMSNEQKTITGLLINPELRSLSFIKVAYDKDKIVLHGLYEAMSTENIRVSLVDAISITGDRNTIWVDDEGLLVNPDLQRYFLWEGRFLAGKAVILGNNPETGDAVDTTLTPLLVAMSCALAWPNEEDARKYARDIFS